jgi:hypothetical protein
MNTAELESIGLAETSLSFAVPPGYTLTLFEEDDF